MDQAKLVVRIVVGVIAAAGIHCGPSDADFQSLKTIVKKREAELQSCMLKVISPSDALRRNAATAEVVKSKSMLEQLAKSTKEKEAQLKDAIGCVGAWEEAVKKDASGADVSGSALERVKAKWEYVEAKNKWRVTTLAWPGKESSQEEWWCHCNGFSLCSFKGEWRMKPPAKSREGE